MLKVQKLVPEAIVPKINTVGEDVAWDLYAVAPIVIPPQFLASVGTGIAIQFAPPAGALILTRSGMARNGADVRGGVIDAGYRGEITVMLKNDHPTEPIVVAAGDRIAQMIRVDVPKDKVKLFTKLSPSKRGGRCFASSGK